MEQSSASRRDFLKASGASAFLIIKPELVRGAGKEMLKAGLVGCGRRGTAAASDSLTGNENVRLVAMGDVFQDQIETSLKQLNDVKTNPGIQDKVKVDPEHRFVGFDAYKKVIASDIDIVMLCTPPAYRPMHFEAAIEARKHVFAEKPIATDPVGARRFIATVRKAEQLKLTVMSGAQRRWFDEYTETVEKIRSGVIGEVVATYARFWDIVRLRVPVRPPEWGDMEFQHRSWYPFVWICGDHMVEQHFHSLDTINWVMGTHPAKVVASGGAAWRPRQEVYGNIYDHMNADFVYANGVHMSSSSRQYPTGSAAPRDDMVVGTKGRSNCCDLGPSKGQFNMWLRKPYVQEHVDMVKSIRGERSYINQGMVVAESTLTAIMARESAYSGLEITWDQIMASQQDLMPKTFDMKQRMETPPLAVPGVYRFV